MPQNETFLDLKHEKLELYKIARSFVHECYKVSKHLPPDERFAMTQQLRRAALPVHLNFAEGCSRRSSAERVRFFEISLGSLIEIDALFDVAFDLEYFKKEQLEMAGQKMISVFRILSKMINPNGSGLS